ncbi:MAG: F0F1 ATP synthase subunit C [Bdellovibrionaceae bacterium]|nr:F0F1 ATP synthase subunit C [Pseudobdellovibrionaceae bacterium]
MKNNIMLTLVGLLSSVPAFAQDAEAMGSGDSGLMALAAGLTIAIAAVGGALGQSKIGASAMEGIARNPQAKDAMFVPMILGLVLIESLVIYALVVAFNLAGKF